MPTIEQMTEEFSRTYMGALFYFCLRKTGNTTEAEDLTQDIALCVLTGLHRGTVPESFHGYVWRIARNRYARWAKAKHQNTERMYQGDPNELQIAAEDDFTDNLVKSEEMASLRRELAFISSEYRHIVVAYYLDDKSIADIAAATSLPEGTVKSRLFRARNILKEGMSMAREFGKLSYDPEKLSFVQSMDSLGELGEPESITCRKLLVNIMVAAYRNPSTAEELAIELGVALPYMEDELAHLVSSTLMKKNSNKYETSFVIVSEDAQERINRNLEAIAPEFTKAIIEANEYRTKALDTRGVKWHGGYQTYEDMKWTLLMKHTDSAEHTMMSRLGIDTVHATPKPNGGKWTLTGLMDYEGKNRNFVGLHCGARNYPLMTYRFAYKRITDKTPNFLYDDEYMAITDAAKGDSGKASPELLAKLEEYGYIKKDCGKYVPSIAVFHGNSTDLLTEDEKREYLALMDKAVQIAASHYNFCRGVVTSEIPEFLRENEHQINHAVEVVFSLRGAVIEEALRTGYIYYNDGEREANDRAIGAFITL